MKISPVTGPGAVQDLSTPEAVRTARAVQAFNKGTATQGQAQETPVQDPNNISVEELSAITSQVRGNSDNITEEVDTEEQIVEEKPKEDPALSRQFAQLARQERALRAKQQQQDSAFKAREAALAEREAKLGTQPSFDPSQYISRAKLQQDALGVLEAEGIATYEDLTQRAISRVPVDPQLQATLDSLRAQVEELKAANETSGKAQVESQQAQYKAALNQISADAKALVKSNPAEYEAIIKTGTVSQVTKLIEDTYNKDGILLSVEEAAQEVENYLVEENFKMATNIDKIKRRMAAANASQNTSDVKTQASQRQTQSGMKTLTNAASSSRQLSAKERAILAFKGELKS